MKEEKPKPTATVTSKDVTKTRTPSVNIYRPPAARIAETKSSTTITDEIKVKDARRTRVRRPDQQVYVPRPRRTSFGGLNNPPVPDSSSSKETLRRLVNDPIVQLNNKSSIKEQQQTDSGSYHNSVQGDIISFSEDNSCLSSCEVLTDLHINGIQTGLACSDDDTKGSSCEHSRSCLVLNSHLVDGRYSNDGSGKSVVVLEENEVSVTQLDRSHDKLYNSEYLNSSNCNSSNSVSSNSRRFIVTKGQQSCRFDGSAEEVETITSLLSRTQEDEKCELQKKEQSEVFAIEEETMPMIDSKERVKQNVESENSGSCQSVIVDCLPSGDTEIDRDAVQLENVSLNISLMQTNETIKTANNFSSGKLKNNVEVTEKSSHEDRNLKNRRILHSFSPVSDVLIISDPVKDESVIKNDIINDKKSVDTTINSETNVNIKVRNKANSSSEEIKNKKDSKSAEITTSTGTTTGTVVSVNKDECDWESMFTEDGECLVPGLIEELTRNVGRVKVATAESDYRSYQTSEERSADGECVIEIYDFPAEFKTHDLLTVFAAYRNRNFHIKWVDDTHALGIFSSPLVADEVLALDLPFVKTRPLRLGIAESKQKARNLILPPMERPKTCTAMARRLVTGALGLRLPSASKEREAERKVLSEARERRRLEAKQREAIWEGLT